jgi:ATP-binding cassette subfamily B (MDR/TAP) protein 1
MAYFDRPENSSSAIGVRLSSDAAAFEQMVGSRLGAICETISLSLVGFIFGAFFSWQLTLIVTAIFIIMAIVSYVCVKLDIQLNTNSKTVLENANRVRLGSDVLYSLSLSLAFVFCSSLLKSYIICVQ